MIQLHDDGLNSPAARFSSACLRRTQRRPPRQPMRWPSNRGRRAIAALLSARTGDVKGSCERVLRRRPHWYLFRNVPSGPDASLNARRPWSSRGESARSQPSHVGQAGRGLNRSITLTARPHCPCSPIAKSASCPRMCSRPFRAIRTPFFVAEPVAFKPTCGYAYSCAWCKFCCVDGRAAI